MAEIPKDISFQPDDESDENNLTDKDQLQQIARLKYTVEQQAARLGGGWRLEQGVMPVVIMTAVEAERLIDRLARLERLERMVKGFASDIEHNDLL